MLLKLSWRNIWRNKWRTGITAASIFFAVLFSIFMNSIQKGAWVRMMDNVVNFYYSYGQIQKKGYWEDKSINKSMVLNDEILNLPGEISGLEQVVPRLESFALASYGEQTSGMLVVGVDPALEDELTNLKDRLTEGEYFSDEDQSVIIAEGVKSLLKINVGDSIVLISQGYHGINAAGKYPVKGIVKFNSPELNKRMIYLPLKTSQYFFGADDLVSSVALKLSSRNDLEDVLEDLNTRLDTSEYKMMAWQEIMPELVEAQKTDAAGNYIILMVLYFIISFGIFGTILMMTKEREYEFGILISIGMKRRLLAISVWLEIVLLGFLGAGLGILGSIPLVHYFKVNPIDLSGMGEEMSGAYDKWGFDPILPTVFEWPIFIYQGVIVFLITSLLALFAIWKIRRLKPMEAMRG